MTNPLSSPVCSVVIKPQSQASSQNYLSPDLMFFLLCKITRPKPVSPLPSCPSLPSVLLSWLSRWVNLSNTFETKCGTRDGLPGTREFLDTRWTFCVNLVPLGFYLILQRISQKTPFPYSKSFTWYLSDYPGVNEHALFFIIIIFVVVVIVNMLLKLRNWSS